MAVILDNLRIRLHFVYRTRILRRFALFDFVTHATLANFPVATNVLASLSGTNSARIDLAFHLIANMATPSGRRPFHTKGV